MKVLPFISVTYLVMMAGCGQQAKNKPSAAVALQRPAEPEPVEKMKSLVAEGKEKLKDSERYKVADVTYDVKKSDSLVSPYDGVVNLHVQTDAYGNRGTENYRVNLRYLFRDGEWVFKSGAYSFRGASRRGYDDAILRGENYKQIKSAVDAFGAHDMNERGAERPR